MLNAVGRDVPPADINDSFDYAASEQVPVIAIFPMIRTEAQLIEQLRRLATDARWTLSRESVNGLVTDDVLVGLQWQTAEGLASVPMGFGPFATMPVTRRAPYVCLATWPGGHANPHRKKFKPAIVDFLDSKLPKPLSEQQYKHTWNTSVKRTGELLSESLDDPNYYRKLAFRLSPVVASLL